MSTVIGRCTLLALVCDRAWSDVSRTNQPPILDPIGTQSVTVRQSLTFALMASNPEEQPIHFGVSPLPLPLGASLDATVGLFTFAPGLEDIRNGDAYLDRQRRLATDAAIVNITVIGSDTGNPTAISGRILDADDFALETTTPVVGAAVRLSNDARTAVSAAGGTFLLDSLPNGSQVG